MRVRQSTQDSTVSATSRFAVLARSPLAVILLAAVMQLGCGVEERPHAAAQNETSTDVYAWPEGDADIAVLTLKDRGEIRIALYPELAPNNVAAFTSLAESSYYDGVTFHRVIRDFMIQAGDPLTRDDDPTNDGNGGMSTPLDDEFSDAPFARGTVAVANKGRPNTGGSQFFIMHKDRRGLDGHYTVLGRVIAGIHLVDDVAFSETDIGARWGPADRPIVDVVIERVQIERADANSGDPTEPVSDVADLATGAPSAATGARLADAAY